jgi:ribosomal protein S18 acetylase RimI-like enzyme
VIEIRRVGADEWQLLRDIRLAALHDAPDAYESTYADEVLMDEAAWRARIRGAAQFVALADDEPIGLAVGLFQPTECQPDERLLVGVWVAPEHRGRRLVSRLVDVVADWARGEGASALVLEVAAGNDAALHAYQRLGFAATGESRRMARKPSVIETRMRRTL